MHNNKKTLQNKLKGDILIICIQVLFTVGVYVELFEVFYFFPINVGFVKHFSEGTHTKLTVQTYSLYGT